MLRLFPAAPRHDCINADIMKPMRLLCFLLCSGALACAGDLSSAKAVYVLPMSHGMDQYLANRLAAGQRLQVVTDPKRADVFLTDHVGESLELQLDDIFPPPEPPKPQPKPDEAAAAPPMFGPAVNKLAVPVSTFGRSKGTFFLVDAKTRQVLWSVYAPPKATTGKELDRTANDIVSRLKKDLKQEAAPAEAKKK
jgi:hypothetical protein